MVTAETYPCANAYLNHVITFSSHKNISAFQRYSEYQGSLLIKYNSLLFNLRSIICQVVAYGG